MKLVYHTISIDELKNMSEVMFDNLVKAVVDIAQGIMVVDLVTHADGEIFLSEGGSQKENVWGINLYPYKAGTQDFIGFDSMINIKRNNPTMTVENAEVRGKIKKIVFKLVQQ